MNVLISNKTALIFISTSCFLYTSKIMISPIYIFFSVFIALLFIYISFSEQFHVDGNFIFGVAGFFYSLLIFNNVTDFGTFANLIMCMLLFLSFPVLFNRTVMNNDYLLLILVGLVFCLYVFESIYRISHPEINEAMLANADESLLFYQYKFNSIMFFDSNFVGLSLISFIAFIDIVYTNTKLKFFLVSLAVVLLILTLSRAAYIAIAFYFPLKYFRLKIKIAAVVFILIIGLYFFNGILSDGSFLSKLKILDYFFDYLRSVDLLAFLFGSGIGSSLDVLGIGSHNLFVLMIVEYGFVFFVWFLFFVVYNIIKTSMSSFPYWCSIFICGFSLGSIYPFVFMPALLLAYQRRENDFE